MEVMLRKKFSPLVTVSRGMFRAHGEFCASRPWEVIIGTVTLTVCLMSMSLVTFNQKVCGWNYACLDPDDTSMSSDRIILTLTRCLAVMYIYLQFRNLRKLGSKYLLGIAGVFTIFSSFVFSIAVIHLIGNDLSGLNEALPFFLLLIDLGKASALAKFALGAKSQEEVKQNIGQGMALLAPAITLDAMVEILVIGVGTLSGVARLETMCCFGCMSVLANYLAFMTFYPACLAIFMEMSHGRPVMHNVQILQFTKSVKEIEDQKPNPVTQRVKIIMSAGLLLVHGHSWLVATEERALDTPDLGSGILEAHYITPHESLVNFYLRKLTSIDYTLTFLLVIVLSFKYILYDADDDIKKDAQPEATPQIKNGSEKPTTDEPTEAKKSETKSDQRALPPIAEDMMEQPICTQPPTTDRLHKPSFTLGDDSDDEDLIEWSTVSTQTEGTVMLSDVADTNTPVVDPRPPRSLEQCITLLNSVNEGPSSLSDEEILLLVNKKKLASYKLESVLGDHIRGISIRRQLVAGQLPDQQSLLCLPYHNYDYKYVEGACCENVIGYMPVPVGTAGPLHLDGRQYTIPMATTEGCLVASTNRGCRAIAASGGVTSSMVGNGMTRAPVVRFPSAQSASEAKLWLEEPEHFALLKDVFQGTSRFTKLKCIKIVQASRNLYIRFTAITGDAMGMNMVSKGCEQVLKRVQEEYFPEMEILSLSGNFCTDKKPSAVNWIEGRGKSVVCEATIPCHVVRDVLKTNVHSLVELNISKNLMGSALAGSMGGFNAHSANIVTAIYIATGQDPAQNVCSSNCMTIMEVSGEDDLYISCTMPSIEVGTVGGGTILPPQAACLQMLGIRGSCKDEPGRNACTLARIICGTVLAGELSLMSALAAGHLVKSHMKHNRSVLNMSGAKSESPLPGAKSESPERKPALTSCLSPSIKSLSQLASGKTS